MKVLQSTETSGTAGLTMQRHIPDDVPSFKYINPLPIPPTVIIPIFPPQFQFYVRFYYIRRGMGMVLLLQNWSAIFFKK